MVMIMNLVSPARSQVLIEACDQVLASFDYLGRLSPDAYRHLKNCHEEYISSWPSQSSSFNYLGRLSPDANWNLKIVMMM